MTAATGHDPRLLDLARRLVWWQDPQSALADERRFLAQAMTDGSWEEMQIVREIYGDDALRVVLGDSRTPPLPRRRL